MNFLSGLTQFAGGVLGGAARGNPVTAGLIGGVNALSSGNSSASKYSAITSQQGLSDFLKGGVQQVTQLALPGLQPQGAVQNDGLAPAGINPSMVVKVWKTQNGQTVTNWARLADGRMMVTRKDGRVKVFRPKKHIVLSSNPRIHQLYRATRRIDKLTKHLHIAKKEAHEAASRIPKKKHAA